MCSISNEISHSNTDESQAIVNNLKYTPNELPYTIYTTSFSTASFHSFVSFNLDINQDLVHSS